MAITKDAFIIVPAIAFLGYVVVASNPQTRMERVCKPVVWGGNMGTSLTALVSPGFAPKVQHFFDKLDYGCQYTLWRLFYQDEYNAYQRQHAPQTQSATASAVTASPASGAKQP